MNGLRALLLACVLGASFSGAGISSCVAQSMTGPLMCPSQQVFTGISPDGGTPAAASVSEYMDRRCGTMDCHGSVAQPMRLYGRFGLREPTENNVSGGATTTPLELDDNYSAACNVEPEATSAVVANDGNGATALLIVAKARGVEAHKGGQIVTVGSPGDECIAGWLRGDDPGMVASACQTAIEGL
jgi:hypothetical protein